MSHQNTSTSNAEAVNDPEARIGALQEENRRLADLNARLENEIAVHREAEAQLAAPARFPLENPNPVLRIRQDGRLLFANKASEGSLPGWPLVVGAPAPAPLAEAAARALREGAVKIFDLDHAGRSISFSVVPVSEAGYVNLYGREMTELKRAEESIRHQNQVLSAVNRLFERVMLARSEEELCRLCLEEAEALTGSKFGFLAETRPDGRLHNLAISNPGWDACKLDELPGKPSSLPSFAIHGIYGQVVAGGRPLIANDPSSHPDRIGLPEGHPLLTAFLGVPLMKEDKVIGMIAVGNRPGGYGEEEQQALQALAPAVVEALARTRAEAQALRLTATLAQRLAELETLMEVAPVGIAIGHDPEGRVITANRALNEWLAAPAGVNVSLGAPEDERQVTYRVVRDGEPVPVEELPIQRAALQGRGFRDDEFQIVHADGSIVDLMANAEPLLDQQGRVTGSVATFMDITARKQAERERDRLLESERAARAAAEAAVRIRDQFIVLASHELRTPLTSLRGYSELLMQRVPALDEQSGRMAGIILRQVQRMEKMVSGLLDIGRIERGQFEIEAAPFDLAESLARWVDDIRPTLRGHTLEFDPPGQGVVVEGDEDRLEQVWMNLVQNAVKYSPRGGAITVRLSRDARCARIAVADEGIGIPASSLPQLFTRFYRADNADVFHFSGLGIGLYVSREIIRLHGGDIEVESQEGHGSTFTVTLPLKTARDGEPMP